MSEKVYYLVFCLLVFGGLLVFCGIFHYFMGWLLLR